MILNENLDTPLYLQLYEHFKERIVNGELDSGERLPSKRQLSESLGISQNTVTKAYYLLEEEGFINAVERSGYFVEKLNNIYISTDVDLSDFEFENNDSNIIYDFSSSGICKEEFPFYTFSKLYREVIGRRDENILINSEPNGSHEFRFAISKHLSDSRGLVVNPKNIVVGSGLEYLFQILFYILDPKTVFAIENPGYDILPPMITSRGFPYVSIDVGGEGIDVESLKKSNANILCITPSHQFPTGNIMPIGKRFEVLEWANQRENNYVVEDDYDSEFRYVGKPIDPLKSLDQKDKVIYIGSFSKSICSSLRISYMILPDKLIESLRADAPFFICSVPLLEQLVMTEFLNNGHFERHLNRMRRIYKKNREIAISVLEKSDKVLEISGADAGIHIIVKFKTDKSDKDLKEELLEKGINIEPLSEFYSSGEKSESKFILGFGSFKPKKLKTGIKEILDVL